MKNYFLLIAIILLAAFLRFWQLGNNPPSLTWDEAAWGYNAYTLGIDGRDEFGKFLPIQYLESFGDFKPPLYAYLTILPVKIFGLNEFSTRFASAFFGTLTVLVTYFLTKRLFHKSSTSEVSFPTFGGDPSPPNGGLLTSEVNLALCASFFLAISPWHINLSRAAFEANVASFFIVCGVWLFLLSMHGKKWWLIDSVISFVLSMYAFNTARIVSPLLLFILIIYMIYKTRRIYKSLIIAGLIGFFLFLPLLQFLLTPQAKLRFNEVNIFSDTSVIEKTNREIKNDNGSWWSKIIHNRRMTYGKEFLKHYFDNFNPSFLFIKGDGNPKFSTQDVGQLYLWEAPFLVIGILWLLRKKEGFWWLISIWLLIGILPAATARETPHALRIETTLPMWQIITAYGIISFIGQIRQIKFRFFFVIFLFSFSIFNFVYYLHGYYTHYAREYSGEWQYGYKETINYLKSVEKDYDKIVFTQDLGRPYIYFLFHNQENPDDFRQTAKIWREAWGFVHVDGYGKYEFIKEINSNDRTSKKVLYVDMSKNVPGDVHILKIFYYLNKQPVLTAYTM